MSYKHSDILGEVEKKIWKIQNLLKKKRQKYLKEIVSK